MSLDIILGPMFAGKSSRILSIVSRYAAVGISVLVIKHSNDVRYVYGEDDIVTHDQRRAVCSSVVSLSQNFLLDRVREHQVIIVDEAQFFNGLVLFTKLVVEDLGKHLYLVGLDGDSNRRPFGELLECIPLADRIERVTAFCKRCSNGTPGLFSHRRSGPIDQQVFVGGTDKYETLCRDCYLHVNSGMV
jgi:thymidine kinase